MQTNLGFRFLVIFLVVGFFAWMSYRGVGREELQLGIDLRGGSEILGKFDFDDVPVNNRAELLAEAIGIIEQRIDGYGLKDISIQPIGDDRFSVQVAETEKENVDSIKGLITVLGRLEFHITVEPSATNYDHYWQRFRNGLTEGKPLDQIRDVKPEDRHKDDIDNGRYPLGLRWYPMSDDGKLSMMRQPGRVALVDGEPQPWVLCRNDDFEITGESLVNVAARTDMEGFQGGWAVVFNIKKLHQGNMAGLTSTPGEFMAIILNDETDSAPELQDTLSSSGRITGNFSEDKARQLAAVLQAGALKQKPELIAERTVASDLAGAARDRGVFSTAAGFVIVLLIMAWLYIGPGLLANLALLLNLVLVVGVLTWFGAVLTLPGIAGVVLTVGMAVDANILVFERIKEEKSKGRTIAQSVATGYDRALVTIIDSNLTTLITAYMLFQIGSGPVRGFGITLAIGIVASMFTALYVTRTIFVWLMNKGVITEARMRGLFDPPKISWMSFQRKAILASTVAMIGGLALYMVVPEKKKYDLDFTQGAKLIVRANKTLQLDDVRSRLDDIGRKNAKFQDVNVRVSADGIGAAVGQTEGQGFEFRTQSIGSKDEIDAFIVELRKTFSGDLLPGPFETTVKNVGGGRSEGTIYFLGSVQQSLVEQAIARFNQDTGRLAGAKVTAEKVPEGAGSAYKLSFSGEAGGAAGIALNVRAAFAGFALDDARAALLARSTDDTLDQKSRDEAKAALDALPATLEEGAFTECDPIPLADRIDPSTARQHRDAAIKAIALSILGIILYVAFRFQSWSFGFAAVVALVHDVLVCLGVVALVTWLGIVDAKLNLVTVAAFLTLIGYSINDSIVVFDRIRENRGTGRARLSETIDRSINQTLSRTIRTTGTTWIVVLILLALNFGANAQLEGFAFILTIGVLVGTYSSIFIAAPTLLYLPWLWERCGGSGRKLIMKAVPWMIGCSAALLAIDAMQDHFSTGDPSVLIFNDIVLGIPLGLMALFLANFVVFVNRNREKEPETAAIG